MNYAQAYQLSTRLWSESILPVLEEYIRIPAKSPHFDADWVTNGHLEDATELTRAWCAAQPLEGMSVEVHRLPGLTPLLFVEVAGTGQGTVLLYGHTDKQPEMTGWDADLGPWKPLLRDGKLYGRGGADDGYAAFASLAALNLLRDQGIPFSRCVMLIENSEESGSDDLPPYLDLLAGRIGQPELVIGLDSGCGNYEQLWVTSSLRGVLNGELRVDVLAEGVHSGDAGGVVPSSFRILRQLLERLEDSATGAILLPELNCAVPAARIAQARAAADVLGRSVFEKFPRIPGLQPPTQDAAELILNRSWRPALAVTGADGFPAIVDAGNVQRPGSGVKLSLRLPPKVDGQQAAQRVKETLEADPPCGARVRFTPHQVNSGWEAPALAPWFAEALADASLGSFNKPVMHMGEGVTIPFISMLGDYYPGAQSLITGVLGPKSNAHGPNEFLHIDMAQRLTVAIGAVIAAHHRQFNP
ncbi:MAG: M20/M25/M40 family metallo-hydrolase [Pseudomonadota bacterium]|nr:M20/M25/M40 family metallo-hydrolase [Pseudomonadota bacterium]